MFYPIGLIALSLHIWNAHSYELSEALFAVSFALVTVAAGKIYDFLTWGLIAIGAVEEISWLIVWRRNYLALPDDALSSLSEQEREEWRRSEERHYKFMRRSLIISAVFRVLENSGALHRLFVFQLRRRCRRRLIDVAFRGREYWSELESKRSGLHLCYISGHFPYRNLESIFASSGIRVSSTRRRTTAGPHRWILVRVRPARNIGSRS